MAARRFDLHAVGGRHPGARGKDEGAAVGGATRDADDFATGHGGRTTIGIRTSQRHGSRSSFVQNARPGERAIDRPALNRERIASQRAVGNDATDDGNIANRLTAAAQIERAGVHEKRIGHIPKCAHVGYQQRAAVQGIRPGVGVSRAEGQLEGTIFNQRDWPAHDDVPVAAGGNPAVGRRRIDGENGRIDAAVGKQIDHAADIVGYDRNSLAKPIHVKSERVGIPLPQRQRTARAKGVVGAQLERAAVDLKDTPQVAVGENRPSAAVRHKDE